MGTVLWIVGEPGVGKTTVIRPFLEGALTYIARPKWTIVGGLSGSICAAGHYRGEPFDGADTLPIGDIKLALAYWEECLRDRALTILDGDKLSTASALARVREAGAEVRCVHLMASEEMVLARRAARGTKQDPTWVKGRKTKAMRFASMFRGGDERFELWADRSPADLTELVRGFLLR